MYSLGNVFKNFVPKCLTLLYLNIGFQSCHVIFLIIIYISDLNKDVYEWFDNTYSE